MKALLVLVLLLAGCGPAPPRAMEPDPLANPAGSAPAVSIGGTFRGYYGTTR